MRQQGVAVLLACAAAGCGVTALPLAGPAGDARRLILARAEVWTPTNVSQMDLWSGPDGPGAVPPGAIITCTHADEEFGGQSPKFGCRLSEDDVVKVKYGGTNGEVYGEVLATRLLWALGFGADRMYPVQVICRGCPHVLGGIARPGDERRFAPAAIERKAAGAEWPPEGPEGWSWTELDAVTPQLGGAPSAHRDALTLLAAFMQHTDSKPENQRILCRGQTAATNGCRDPLLMLNDVGLTFGRATLTNDNDVSGVNLRAWRNTPVWKDEARCIGNLSRSFSGTLSDPPISEEGRQFLAALLEQLSDTQLHHLFSAASVDLRPRDPEDVFSGFPTIQEWVDAFKSKRREITSHRCPPAGGP